MSCDGASVFTRLDWPRRGRYRRNVPSYNPMPMYAAADGSVAVGLTSAIEAENASDFLSLAVDGPMHAPWDQLRAAIESALRSHFASVSFVDMREHFVKWNRLQELTLTPELHDDPDFARLPDLDLRALFDGLPELPDVDRGAVVIYGPGAALTTARRLWYLDVPKRFAEAAVAAGRGRNLGQPEASGPPTFKRLFYIDWSLTDRHRDAIASRIDRFIDGAPDERDGVPGFTSIDGPSLRETLRTLSTSPIRTRPTFNTTTWGGHWAQDQLGMNPVAENTALGYELIAPESGVLIGDAQAFVEVPFQMLVAQEALAVLGSRVRESFGTSFPIRFDYLDTVRGGNLSVHCHPQLDYMREVFGWPYTQHETYYMMVGGPDRKVFLGLRADVDVDAFHAEAHAAHHHGVEFDIEKYVQTFPANHHQLFVIPAGTPHGSGEGNVVLEVSATPYLYSLRFFDWLRRDAHGKQRPVHVEKAFENLNTHRTGIEVEQQLVQNPRELRSGPGWNEQVLGQLPEMFFEVRRISVERDARAQDDTDDRFHVYNVVAGEAVEVSWGDGQTQTFAYAETFVMPASVGPYSIRHVGSGTVQLVKAVVR